MNSTELQRAARAAEKIFHRHGVRLTLGGEPTYVPIDPEGPEWNYSAVGPTKLTYARAMAEKLREQLGDALVFFTPGKSYPGEVNPRWALKVVAQRDGSPIFREVVRPQPITAQSLAKFRDHFLAALELDMEWTAIRVPDHPDHFVWALAVEEVDPEGHTWEATGWEEPVDLLAAEGPAGLRLPLHLLPPETPRRAVTLEWKPDGTLAIFLPPVVQSSFAWLLKAVDVARRESGVSALELQGYVPGDEAQEWTVIGLTADPGVLEVNLPACLGWAEYDHWIRTVTQAAESVGLRSWKSFSDSLPEGSGGGNHLLWGGPQVDETPMFTHPGWLASLLRYWQHHPALAYAFTGCYVGASSQAPRADESAHDLHDLEMAIAYLESLPPGDHRVTISETLRHLQTDVTGNAHRSEISFDKFWNVGWPAGTLGLMEFRAIESLPRADWMSAIALLWVSIGARLLDSPFRAPLRELAHELHDRYFLPEFLWQDLQAIFSDLHAAGLDLDTEMFRAIWDWKFPLLWQPGEEIEGLSVRRAHEGWPLLCEIPVDGSTTSRFVDTSMRRLEFLATAEFCESTEIRIAGRPLPLHRLDDGRAIAGLRYRRTNLYPSLHPGLPPQVPLEVRLVQRAHPEADALCYEIRADSPRLHTLGHRPAAPAAPLCRNGRKADLTYDLRIT